MAKKKRFTAEKKVEILREFLENRVSVSDLAEKYGVHPNSIHQWKKQLFEGAVTTLDDKRERLKERQTNNLLKYHQRKEAALNEVIAELTQDNLKLKKNNGGI
ncbi:MAG TPA: transposase [bacterium]|nr:transposase [bacterium]